MRLLYISWYFPPGQDIAAIRASRTVEYLIEAGIDVQVITVAREVGAMQLTTSVPDSHVHRTGWFDIDRIAHPQWSRPQRKPGEGGAGQEHDGASGPAAPNRARELLTRLRGHIAQHYNSLFFFPDRQIGWVGEVVKTGEALAKQKPFDLILASGPPFSSFIAARLLQRKLNTPYVLEFRDRWANYAYAPRPAWRNWTDAQLERHLAQRAAGLITVSPIWEPQFAERYGRATLTVLNGYDGAPQGEAEPSAKPETLRIVHTGALYQGLRDPTPLFEAIAALPSETRSAIELLFYGKDVDCLEPLIDRFGVADAVRLHAPIPFQESLAVQRAADVLLLLQHNDTGDIGNVPGKFFEYLGMRRPMLGIGLEAGYPARIVRDRGLGLYSNAPEDIAGKLAEWVEAKRAAGKLPPLSPDQVRGFSRRDNIKVLESFLRDRAEQPSLAPVQVSAPAPVAPATLPKSDAPMLLVVVDTEEEFDWNQSFSRDDWSLRSIAAQGLAQDIHDQYGLVPTYVVDYPVADDPDAAAVIQGFLDQGKAELGAHLQPWVNPPFEEVLTQINSFPGNLPYELEYKKLQALTERITERFSQRPRIYKAGRYGIGPNTPKILKQLGYEVDASIVPFTDFRSRGGPNFLAYDTDPFWFGEDGGLLEVPLTRGFTGALGGVGPSLFPTISGPRAERLRLPGAMARTGLLNRVTLTPEGVSVDEHIELTRSLMEQGQRLFCYTYHSSSLLAGATNYVRSEADLAAHLDKMRGYFDFFFNTLGGRATTLSALRRAASEARLSSAGSAAPDPKAAA